MSNVYRDRCVEPGCDGEGFYSARCKSHGHRKVVVEYVPADQLRGAVEERDRLRDENDDLRMKLDYATAKIERYRDEMDRITTNRGQSDGPVASPSFQAKSEEDS